MQKEEGKEIYIFGDSDTIITPTMIVNDDGTPDYIALIFHNENLYQQGETISVGDADLVLGFKSAQSIDLLIGMLNSIKENYLKEPEEK